MVVVVVLEEISEAVVPVEDLLIPMGHLVLEEEVVVVVETVRFLFLFSNYTLKYIKGIIF